jgi:ABC-type lipoprotein release transport system permease subunit
VLNQPLADQLHATVGDEVLLRLPQASDVPADSPLGRKTETSHSRRFTVSEIIPAEGLGRFGVRPTQQLPWDAFTAIEPLQQLVDVPGRVNAILVAGHDESGGPDSAAEQVLRESLQPALADYGLTLRKTDRGYFNLTSDRMLLEPAVNAAAMKAFQSDGAQPVFTYLANYILAARGRGKIPYSTIAAVDFSAEPPLGPLLNRQGQPIGPLASDQIVLNAWAADDLSAQGAPVKPGDKIEITYFEPESEYGQITESRHAFRLKDITPLTGVADDPNFTPEVKGVTDEASIANWNPPFPYDPSRVRSVPPNNQDDLYWKQHRATPKAFVSLEQGRSLWGSRFGETTSIRIPSREGMTESSLSERLLLQLDPKALGFDFLPVKRLGLEAAAGTTPFAILFLGFSMFIIAAALMLVMLLFKLGAEQRAAELGILLGVGFRRSLARRVMLLEGSCVAAVGAAAGAAAGIGYAWLMIVGLKTWWLGAISTPFLDLHIAPASIAIGYVSGVLVSLLTIAWALRQMRRVSVQRLLAGEAEELRPSFRRGAGWTFWIVIAILIAAVASGLFSMNLGGEVRAGGFLGAGSLVLVALMIWTWSQLRADHISSLQTGRLALARLAWRNGSRHPLRSTLTIGLTAAACFLILALSAFQLEPPSRGPVLRSSDGGFALVAQSDQPIYQDLNTVEGRHELDFGSEAEHTLAVAQADGARIFSFRVHNGDDASCLNLYQPRQPRILGVPRLFTARGGFAWTDKLADSPMQENNPWLILDRTNRPGKQEIDPTSPIPVVLDKNTAVYSLHLSGSAGEEFEIDRPGAGRIKLQIAALLENSIFQGDLLIGEEDFLRLFPNSSGYRFFLVETPPEFVKPLAEALETSLDDYGFETQTTAARLAGFFAVQNTYLATFRSLGGLGLLLGTFGLAIVQLRSIVERRGELALLRATGFRRRRLAQMVMLENASLLIVGLGIGAIAALVALLPHLFAGGAKIPWSSLAATLIVVLVVGLLAGLIAVRAVLKAPLLPALRGE